MHALPDRSGDFFSRVLYGKAAGEPHDIRIHLTEEFGRGREIQQMLQAVKDIHCPLHQ